MEDVDRKQEYRAKAKEAEEQAAQTKDIVMRGTWLKIAESYRDLAVFVERKSDKEPSLEQPSLDRSLGGQTEQ
jgi:hypothetical protein